MKPHEDPQHNPEDGKQNHDTKITPTVREPTPLESKKQERDRRHKDRCAE